MARDDSFEERKRKRELEDQRDREAQARARVPTRASVASPAAGSAADSAIDSIEELFGRVEPLIERLNGLYSQYITGVELRPPVEVRGQLDQLVAKLRSLGKATPAQLFRFSSLNASYMTHSERWDRMCRDLESGKIKRAIGPK